ncbi:MAG: hypothetical protein LBK08_02630 [Treponema sp.]|jgi:hypothetical protein|nr:hypothetical protein [Treponema sp.]
MKKINGHILKGTVKQMFGALALAGAISAAGVIGGTAVSCSNPADWDREDNHKVTGGIYDPDGYKRNGFNASGWNREHKNETTGTLYDNDGYNENGYNQYGWDIEENNVNTTPYNDNGFKMDGTYLETGSYYDGEGYNRDGYDINGYDAAGCDIDGYDVTGYDADGWHRDPASLINKFTGTEYGLDGNDRNGNPNPTVIPEYTSGMDVVLNTVYGEMNQYTITAGTLCEIGAKIFCKILC